MYSWIRQWRAFGLVLVAAGLLSHCGRDDTTVYQYRFAFCVTHPKDEYWLQIEKGLNRALSGLGAKVKAFYMDDATQLPCDELKKESDDWQGCALVPGSTSTDQTVLELIQAGIPVICVGSDAPQSVRLAVVSTHYYEIGRKLGHFFAGRLSSGTVLLVGYHPVTGALDHCREGLQYELGINRRLALQVLSPGTPDKIEKRLQNALSDPDIRGVVLFGALTLERGIPVLRASDKGAQVVIAGVSYKPQDREMVKSKVCEYGLLEKPEETGYRAGRILWDLAQGRQTPTVELLLPPEVLSSR